MKHSLILIAALVFGALGARAGYPPVPRDTSFTIHSTAVKTAKKHPELKVATPAMPAGVKARQDVVYTTIRGTKYGDRRLLADVYRPDNDSLYPALIMVHGGGWNSGDKTLQRRLAQQIAAHGYVTIPIEYRLLQEAQYPAGLHDVKTAVRWVRAKAAELGVDTTRVAISGCSAGGQLAALVGTTNGSRRHEGNGEYGGHSSDVQAVVDIDGIVTFVSDYNLADVAERVRTHNGEWPVNARWLGGLPDDVPDNWAEASSILWVTDRTAPVCFINSQLPRYHDGRDPYCELLKARGIATEVYELDSPIHPFWFFDPFFDQTVAHTVSFLDRTLSK